MMRNSTELWRNFLIAIIKYIFYAAIDNMIMRNPTEIWRDLLTEIRQYTYNAFINDNAETYPITT